MSRYEALDFYCYKNSRVLKNRLGIKDGRKLKTFERKLSSLRLSEIRKRNLSFPLTFAGYKETHEFIFKDIYSWAGKIRKVDIKKGSSVFCNFLQIDLQAEHIFNGLLQSNYLVGMSDEQYLNEFSHLFGNLNALHPFRDGNGRCEREFLRQLALKANKHLDFSNIRKQEILTASIDSFYGEYESTTELFKKALSQKII